MTESKICTCPSGDGSLVHPCPAHPAVEQAGGDERAAFELFVRKHCGMPEHIAVNWDAKFTNDAWEGWQARAALAQPSPTTDSRPAEWSSYDPTWVVDFIRDNSIFNADLIERMLEYATRPAGDVPQAEQAEAERPIVSFEKYMQVMYDRDEHAKRLEAAQARVAELELGIARIAGDFLPDNSGQAELALDEMRQALHELLAAAPTQAQHSGPETTNKEANSFLRVADAGQFKDNAAAVRTAAMIIRGLLHGPAIMKSIIRHRIGLTPEYEGQWHADLYGEAGEVQHHAEADTPDEAVRAVVALAAAHGKEGV
ncbi:hypothetical protein ACWQOO_005805 [Pseudomonas aeruginosa]